MEKSKTHFEQVSLEVVRKIAIPDIPEVAVPCKTVRTVRAEKRFPLLLSVIRSSQSHDPSI